MKRVFDPEVRELMDLPQAPSPELERDLRNLEFLNRWFGSHALIRKHLAGKVTPGKTWRLLDLATGGADLPREMVLWARERGISLEIDAVDFQPGTVALARKWCRDFPEITVHEGDVLTFGQERTWDGVFCSLALHHFSSEDAVKLLRRSRELGSKFTVVSDLRRCWHGWLGVYLLTAVLMREPMTWHDARLSVQRAFSFDEFADLARQAGWEKFTHARAFCSRQVLCA